MKIIYYNKYMLIPITILIIIIIFFYINNNVYKNDIKYEIKYDSFVKPKNKLLEIFNDLSSNNKLKLAKKTNKYIYTHNTIPENINQNIVNDIKIIIKYIKNIDSDLDYYIKNINQVYLKEDEKGNKRYIVEYFIYDISNFYTLKIMTDYIKLNNDKNIYINSIVSLLDSYSNILNRYDYGIFSRPYLHQYNMFDRDTDKLLDEKYIKYNQVIGIDDVTLDYSYINNMTKLNNDIILDNLTKYYYPSNMKQEYSSVFCDKHLNEWDETSAKIPKNKIDKNCISNNNSTLEKLNRPYFAPGIITERVQYNPEKSQIYMYQPNVSTQSINTYV